MGLPRPPSSRAGSRAGSVVAQPGSRLPSIPETREPSEMARSITPPTAPPSPRRDERDDEGSGESRGPTDAPGPPGEASSGN
eukprot:6698369-Pyramimonas_sp.AAC.1